MCLVALQDPLFNDFCSDKEMYRRRNEVERLFRRLRGFRNIFTRFDKPESFLCSSFILRSSYETLICMQSVEM